MASPIAWGLAATGLVAATAIALSSGETCNWIGHCENRFAGFLKAPANEIGDTLAGFAGALAFVWIIVTVWLQSRELAAQREELRLTREEVTEQRKATQDMASAMAAQAAIFEDERVYRNETRSHNHLSARIDMLYGIARRILDLDQHNRFDEDWDISELCERLRNAHDGAEISEALLHFFSALPDYLPLHDVDDLAEPRTHLYELEEDVAKVSRSINSMIGELSVGDRQIVENMNLETLTVCTEREMNRYNRFREEILGKRT